MRCCFRSTPQRYLTGLRRGEPHDDTEIAKAIEFAHRHRLHARVDRGAPILAASSDELIVWAGGLCRVARARTDVGMASPANRRGRSDDAWRFANDDLCKEALVFLVAAPGWLRKLVSGRLRTNIPGSS